MKKRILSLSLVMIMLCTLLPKISITASAATRYEVSNPNNCTGQDIVDEARTWANSGATYVPGGLTGWPDGVAWRTGLGSTLYFDCIGFVSRVLNDCGFRAPSYPTPDGGSQVALYNTYGAGYITCDMTKWMNYGPDISAAVSKAKNGDYSDLQPGDILGWLNNGGNHVVIYAGLKNGTPWMVEFTGSGYRDRAITATYQSKFQYGARFATEANSSEEEHADTPNIRWWVADSEYGELPSEYKVGNRYWLCYRLYDSVTGKNWDEVANNDYTVSLAFYYPDGTLMYSWEYDYDQSWISCYFDEPGTYTLSVELTGDYIYHSTGHITVQEDPIRIHASTSNLHLTLGGTETQTISVWSSGFYKGSTVFNWQRDNSNIIVSWGEWAEDGTCPLYVTANEPGTSTITLSVRDNDTQAVLDVIEIPVTVTRQTYSVVYDGNGGFNVPASQTKEYDVDLTLSAAIPERFPYNFMGWRTPASRMYQPGDIYSENEAITFTAEWVGPAALEVGYDDGYVRSNAPILWGGYAWTYYFIPEVTTYYRFLGIDDVDNMIVLRDSGGVILESDDDSGGNRQFELEYYLEAGRPYFVTVKKFNSALTGEIDFLTLRGFNVHYDANGGVDAPPPDVRYVDEEYVISERVPTRSGYSFIGWSLDPNATEPDFLPGESIDYRMDLTLYAVWMESIVTTTCDLREATYNNDSSEKWYQLIAQDTTCYFFEAADIDEVGEIKLTLYDDEGKILACVKGNNTCELEYAVTSGEVYYVHLEYDDASSCVFLATYYGYKITFDSNGGTGDLNPVYTYYAGPRAKIGTTIPYREGYVFVEWNTRPDGTGASYQPNDEINAGDVQCSATILYAIWQAEPVLYGDVNGDGNVNTKDRMVLTRYLAGMTGYTADMIDMKAADVNCDGTVNAKDRMILTRYLAQWTAYPELPHRA